MLVCTMCICQIYREKKNCLPQMLLGPFLNTLTHLIHRKVQKASKNLRAIDGLANLFLNVAFFLNWNTLTVS